MAIKCLSHNVRGFNSPVKRRKAFTLYNQMKDKILLIQETHFSETSHPKFFHRNYSQSFYTMHLSKSRGAAIFLHSTLPFEVRKVFWDKDSRFVIVKGAINNKELTIASVYAPNDPPASFFTSFFEHLTAYQSPHMIVGGDFNLVANPSLDRTSVSTSARAFHKSLTRALREHQLIDSWRAHNIGAKEFTFFSQLHNSSARLDYIFVSPIILANSRVATILPCVWSDHQIETEFIGLAPTPFAWRLNKSLLSDAAIEAEVLQSIDQYFELNALPETPISIVWTAHKAVL